MKNLDLDDLKEKLIGLQGRADYKDWETGDDHHHYIIDVVTDENGDIFVVLDDTSSTKISLDYLILNVPYANVWSFKYYAGDFNDNNTAFNEHVILDLRYDEDHAKKAIAALFNNGSYFSIWDLKVTEVFFRELKPNWEEFE